MRGRACQKILIIIVSINLVLLWYLSQHPSHDASPTGELRDVASKWRVAVVVPEFASFDHDIAATLLSIQQHGGESQAFVISERLPYPYFNLPYGKFLILSPSPDKPSWVFEPLSNINSDYILIVPDGLQLQASVALLIDRYVENVNNYEILAFAPDGPSLPSCQNVEVNLKTWTLTYGAPLQLNDDSCEYTPQSVALCLRTSMLRNLTEHFKSPFYEAFFIQSKLRNWRIKLVQTSVLKTGKLLFTDPHNRWKRDISLINARKSLYERFGVKRVINADGREEWFGCTKASARCFPSVDDVPSYLYDEKWTPPCCLRALRETARHVFSTFADNGISYWLEGGSLLGAARSGDIIPWDYDVDIGMFLHEIDKVRFLSDVWKGAKLVDADGFVWERAREGDFIRVQYSESNHLHVDIFPFYERNGIMTKNTWFKTHRQDAEFPAHYLKPLRQLNFVGVNALAPNHHVEFLEMKFGKGVIEHPEYPFPEKLRKIQRFV